MFRWARTSQVRNGVVVDLGVLCNSVMHVARHVDGCDGLAHVLVQVERYKRDAAVDSHLDYVREQTRLCQSKKVVHRLAVLPHVVEGQVHRASVDVQHLGVGKVAAPMDNVAE